MICPMMSRPINDRSYHGDGVYQDNIVTWFEQCQIKNCAWHDGEQCAVLTIAQVAKSVTFDNIFDDLIDRLKKAGVIA